MTLSFSALITVILNQFGVLQFIGITGGYLVLFGGALSVIITMFLSSLKNKEIEKSLNKKESVSKTDEIVKKVIDKMTGEYKTKTPHNNQEGVYSFNLLESLNILLTRIPGYYLF